MAASAGTRSAATRGGVASGTFGFAGSTLAGTMRSTLSPFAAQIPGSSSAVTHAISTEVPSGMQASTKTRPQRCW